MPAWVVEGEEPDPRLRDEGAGDGRAEYRDKKNVSAGERLDGALSMQQAQVHRQGLNGGVNGTGGRTGTRTGTGVGATEKSLDDWLAESEESEEGKDDEDDESEESSEEESSGEEESEEDEEDDGEEERLVK